jgi:hypothetical protein
MLSEMNDMRWSESDSQNQSDEVSAKSRKRSSLARSSACWRICSVMRRAEPR